MLQIEKMSIYIRYPLILYIYINVSEPGPRGIRARRGPCGSLELDPGAEPASGALQNLLPELEPASGALQNLLPEPEPASAAILALGKAPEPGQ